jgi:glucoamylase
VLYTTDNWATQVMKQSRPVGYAGSYADIATRPGQSGRIIFTFYWPGQNRWLGRNFETEIVSVGS